MSSRTIFVFLIFAVLASAAAGPALAADYRGMPAGWPNYSTGYYAANYPAAYGNPGAYAVARPVAAPYYAGGGAPVVAYMPANVAYNNPSYLAAYGATPVTAYRAPVAAAGYYQQPTTAYYAPAPAAYAPRTAGYAPSYSYAVSPAGGSYAGSEAMAAYAQPTNLNYVPQRVTYRPAYAAVPVYAYRPVTVYNPITAQPTTCLQPVAVPTTCRQPVAAPSTCGSQRRSCFSWLNPCNWFRGGCGSGCGSAPPSTAYCTTNYCQAASCTQAQPYYPAPVPVIPTYPAPATVIPTNPAPAATAPIFTTPSIPSAGPRIPPTPTRTPGFGTAVPADTQPRLGPGTLAPGGTIGPAPTTTFPPAPGSGSFPVGPSGSAPGFGSGSITPGSSIPGGSFPAGTNYPPSTDPYNIVPLTPSTTPLAPNSTIFGSGYRAGATAGSSSNAPTNNVIRAPDLGPALPPSIRPVPDLDATEQPKPINRAPQLISPQDKTTLRTNGRWAVVPARWPTPPATATAARNDVRPVNLRQPTPVTQPNPAAYDDGGWKSATSYYGFQGNAE